MSFIWKHFCFSTSFLLVSVWGNYSGITIIENEDHYSIVKVEGGKYEDFGNVDCSQQLFEQGYYDDGTACKNATANENYCVCFRWTDESKTRQHKNGRHFSKVCGKCRDPNALMLETYKNPDIPNHFAIVEVKKGELFGKVDCADQIYQEGLYYDGMPCLNATINDRFCVCFRWIDKKKTRQHKTGNHFSIECGKCRDPNALVFP